MVEFNISPQPFLYNLREKPQHRYPWDSLPKIDPTEQKSPLALTLNLFALLSLVMLFFDGGI
jgi:hypothetical protein